MAYITHHHRPTVAARLNIPRLASLAFNVVLWVGVLAVVERCTGLGRL